MIQLTYQELYRINPLEAKKILPWPAYQHIQRYKLPPIRGEKPALLAYPLLAIPVSVGNKDYLAWISEVTSA